MTSQKSNMAKAWAELLSGFLPGSGNAKTAFPIAATNTQDGEY